MINSPLIENSNNFEAKLKNIFFPFGGLSYIFIIAILYASIIMGLGIYLLGIFIVLLATYFFIKFPKFWLYSVTATFGYYCIDQGEGISITDVLFGGLYIGSLTIWFFWTLIIKKEKIVKNFSDFVILLFFALLILNFVISYFNDVELSLWFRQFFLFGILLFYFPIRKYFTEDKDIKLFMIILGLTTLIPIFYQFYIYFTVTLSSIKNINDFGRSVRMNQVLFTSMALLGLIFLVYQKNVIFWLSILSFMVLNILALISTFSRTFWIDLVLLIIVVFILLPKKEKFKVIISTISIFIIVLSSLFFIFQNNLNNIENAIEKRFLSSGDLGSDASVMERMTEYRNDIKLISDYPLGGNGWGKKYIYFNPTSKRHDISIFMHNGFLQFFYFFGIPLSLVFFLNFFINLVKSGHLAWKINYTFDKLLILLSFCILLLFFISDFSTTIYIQRDGTFVLFVAYSFLGIIDDRENKRKFNEKLKII